jgi:hypothetical protein
MGGDSVAGDSEYYELLIEKIMKFKYILVLLIAMLQSCNHKEKNNEIKVSDNSNIDSLIFSNREKTLFLSYYDGLDEENFINVTNILLKEKVIFKKNDSIFYEFSIDENIYEAHLKPFYDNKKLKAISLDVQSLCKCFIDNKVKRENQSTSISSLVVDSIDDENIVNNFLNIYSEKYGKPTHKIFNYLDNYFWENDKIKILMRVNKMPIDENNKPIVFFKKDGKIIKNSDKVRGYIYENLEIIYGKRDSNLEILKADSLNHNNRTTIEKKVDDERIRKEEKTYKGI